MGPSSSARDVGIKALEIYFPHYCVDQEDLERFMGVSRGKFTIGLGQTKMSFCDDREDIYSMALTVVSSLFRKYKVDPASIGRLEVATESPLDKSKSCKTVLMQLFESAGNTNMEGADTFNACYGGTNALFNAINWVESRAWDGRDALVVAGDIALYKDPAARPTGGAGCVAMLIGPDAPLVFDVERGSFFRHAYDFYKADMSSEYPLVDGQLSIRCYLEAVDKCYEDYHAKVARRANHGVNGASSQSNATKPHGNGTASGPPTPPIEDSDLETPLDKFDYLIFHAPNCKLVAKSYARLLYNDFVADSQEPQPNPLFSELAPSLRDIGYAASLTDKPLETAFMKLTARRFAERVSPSLLLPRQCGNMYTASVYSGLASLVASVPAAQLRGKRVGLFSYGSGLAASLFSLRVAGNEAAIANMADKLDLHRRL